MLILFVMLEILGILVICKIIMGSADAIINDWKKFDWKTFIKGIFNYLIAFAVMVAVYYTGILAEQVPDLNTLPIKILIGTLIGAAIAKTLYEVLKWLGVFWGVLDLIKDKLGLALGIDINTEDTDTPITPTEEEINQVKEGA